MAGRVGARRKRESAESSSVVVDDTKSVDVVESMSVAEYTRARAEWHTDGRITALTALLEMGVPMNAACARLAIPRSSLNGAMETNEPLRQRIEAARASWEAGHVAYISADLDWKARAWMLERRIPKRWSPPKNRSEISGPDGAPVQLAAVDAVDRMSDAELTAAAKTLLGGGE